MCWSPPSPKKKGMKLTWHQQDHGMFLQVVLKLQVYWSSFLRYVVPGGSIPGNMHTEERYPKAITFTFLVLQWLPFHWCCLNSVLGIPSYTSGTNGRVQASQIASIHSSSLLCSRYPVFPSSDQHCLCFLHLGNKSRKALEANPK